MGYSPFDAAAMQRAVELARRGRGLVEPNPMVGAVVADAAGARYVGEGWHARYGGPHAEVVALAEAGPRARGATLYVTLEPCCHHGKTPPCTDAILAAGVGRVVAATVDPHPLVAGGGLSRLAAAGVAVATGLEEAAALDLTAPYRSLLLRGRPWVIAKWATGAGGGLGSPPGRRWLSNDASRALVHRLRGEVDAILVGSGTALADDPLLTARPAGPRTPLRVVLDGRGRLAIGARLVATANEAPLLVATTAAADPAWIADLRAAGADVWVGASTEPATRLAEVLAELGARRCTNVLVEGGARLLHEAFAAGLVDEAWVFVTDAPTTDPATVIRDVPGLEVRSVDLIDGDILLRASCRHPTAPGTPERSPGGVAPSGRGSHSPDG